MAEFAFEIGLDWRNGTELIIINEPAIRLLSVTGQYESGQLDPSAEWDQIDLLTQHRG